MKAIVLVDEHFQPLAVSMSWERWFKMALRVFPDTLKVTE